MSITLTNPVVTQQGVSTLENDTVAGASTYTLDAATAAPVFVCRLQLGTGVLSQAISVNKYSSQITVSVNLVTGAWATDTGVSGTLSGGALTSFVNSLKALRNTVETFAITNGIVAGTQVGW